MQCRAGLCNGIGIAAPRNVGPAALSLATFDGRGLGHSLLGRCPPRQRPGRRKGHACARSSRTDRGVRDAGDERS